MTNNHDDSTLIGESSTGAINGGQAASSSQGSPNLSILRVTHVSAAGALYLLGGLWCTLGLIMLMPETEILVFALFRNSLVVAVENASPMKELAALSEVTGIWSFLLGYVLILGGSLCRPCPEPRRQLLNNPKRFFGLHAIALAPLIVLGFVWPILVWSWTFEDQMIFMLVIPVVLFSVLSGILAWTSADYIIRLAATKESRMRKESVQMLYSALLFFSLFLGLLPLHLMLLYGLEGNESSLLVYVPMPVNSQFGWVLRIKLFFLTSSALIALILFAVFLLCGKKLLTQSIDELYKFEKEAKASTNGLALDSGMSVIRAGIQETSEDKRAATDVWARTLRLIDPFWKRSYRASLLIAVAAMGIVGIAHIFSIGLARHVLWLNQAAPNSVVSNVEGGARNVLVALAWAGISEELTMRAFLIGLPTGIISLMKERRTSLLAREDCVEILKMHILGGYAGRTLSSTQIGMMVLSGIWFGWAHIVGGWPLWKMISASVAGIVFAYLFIRYGLAAAIFAHYA